MKSFSLLWVLLCASAATFGDIIDDSLRLRFSFDAAPVNDVVVDSSPDGLHPGVNHNTSWLVEADNRSGVVDFNAPLPNRITVPPQPALNSPQGTISFWMKSSGTSGGGDFGAILFDRRTTSGDVLVLQDSGTLFVQAREGGQNVNSFSSFNIVNDGLWHHVAYVYDQSLEGSTTLFIDGLLDSTQPNSAAWNWPASQPIELGSSHDPFWRLFEGFMDDFMIHNRMLTETEIAAAAAGNAVLDESLVLRLNFAAAPENDVVVDSSSSNNAGTNQGATWVASEDSRTGVMEFNLPVTTQITVDPHPDFDVTAGTIAFWMQSTGNTGPGDFGSILFDRRTGGNGDVIVLQNEGTLFVQAHGSGQTVNSFSTLARVDDGEWHHVAYVFDQAEGGSTQIYIDGALSGSQVNTAAWFWPAEQPIELGLSHDSFWHAYNGLLDEVRFYNRPLSAAEIAEVGVAPTLRFDLHPVSQSVFVGDDVRLTALVNVDATYQWQLNGTDLPGQTSSTLDLTGVDAGDAGTYTVVATSSLGELTSNPAELTVNPRPSLQASLVARYNFEAAPVEEVIVDTAPGGDHHGTNIFAFWVEELDGRSGVMQFVSDPGSQIVVPAHSEFDSSKGTISFWMKSPGAFGFGNWGAILFDRRSDRGDVIVMQDDGALFVQASNPSARVNSFATPDFVNDDLWHHVSYVYDQAAGGSIQIYIDGELSHSNRNSAAWSWDPAQPLEFGKSHDAYWRALDGHLDDIQIFNRTLSATEITQVMNPGPALPEISVSRSGDQLTLSWMDDNFVLQEKSDLGDTDWANVTGGDNSPVTVPISATENRFFRLVQP